MEKNLSTGDVSHTERQKSSPCQRHGIRFSGKGKWQRKQRKSARRWIQGLPRAKAGTPNKPGSVPG